RSLGDEDFAEIAVFAQTTHVLHHRVIPQVVARAIAKFFRLSELDKLAAFCARCREWLLAEDVFARLESFERDWRVLNVGCADMHRIDRWIVENFSIVGFGALDA